MLSADRTALSELAKMTAASQAERTVLEEEFNWLLKEEVHSVLKQLQDILKEVTRRFSMPSPGLDGQLKQENFILGSSTMDQIKGVLTLQGEALTQADINFKVAKSSQVMHFAFRDDKQWKLQQIQDARNHVSQALQLLSSRNESYHFKTGAEVNKLMDAVMLQLTRARNRLTTPASMTLPELASSGLMNFKSAGSSVLHNPGTMFEYNNTKFEVSHVHKVECVVPWLNDTLVFFTISLQLCQQLKDKISVFSNFWNYRPF
ncbi:protein rogdi homolog isoform X2 [Myxocyprinus asiaticus]|uniref:protein rogdi homolog isoform X2 n=1 Tax=Myxocyprinus asiaticus TaxID=70543 RepID=UPI002221321C|nr:protein rogdi homolog isoform X2 [Myxocyprinus asiaticus]